MIEAAAIDLLAGRLKTPLQIEQHLAMAFEEAFRIGERTVSAAVIEGVLSRHLDDLEPRLTRHGYSVSRPRRAVQRQAGGNPPVPARRTQKRASPGTRTTYAGRRAADLIGTRPARTLSRISSML